MATQFFQDKKGSTFIAATQRADGTWRKPIRVKEGFVPQEEVPLYESKGKKFAKEAKANEGLPAGLTKEAWEKMKEAQANLLNVQQKASKKKANKKKNTSSGDNQNDNPLDNTTLNNVNQTNTTQSTGSKKKKNKNKQSSGGAANTNNTTNNENSSVSVNAFLSTGSPSNAQSNSGSVVDDWVTMGKQKPTTQSNSKKSSTANTDNVDKATSAVENLRLDHKKNSRQTSSSNNNNNNKKRIDQLVVSKGVDELANDMLVDEDQDADDDDLRLKEKTNEKQQLIKKIKTLKKKLKDVDTLKELSKQKSLDKEQKEKVSKADLFSKDLAKLQAKLDLINKK